MVNSGIPTRSRQKNTEEKNTEVIWYFNFPTVCVKAGWEEIAVVFSFPVSDFSSQLKCRSSQLKFIPPFNSCPTDTKLLKWTGCWWIQCRSYHWTLGLAGNEPVCQPTQKYHLKLNRLSVHCVSYQARLAFKSLFNEVKVTFVAGRG